MSSGTGDDFEESEHWEIVSEAGTLVQRVDIEGRALHDQHPNIAEVTEVTEGLNMIRNGIGKVNQVLIDQGRGGSSWVRLLKSVVEKLREIVMSPVWLAKRFLDFVVWVATEIEKFVLAFSLPIGGAKATATSTDACP